MGKMEKAIFFCSIILLTVVSSCKKENNPIPPEDQPQINLTLEDVSCTEAWIKLSTSNLSLPADIDLYRDSSLAERINLATADTVLYVDSLLPNQSYLFHSIIQFYSPGAGNNQSITSDVLPVSTMDTTSQDFTWQTWTFGEHSSSILNDVAIIDENNIWAVGEIYLLDSTGVPDPNAYNAVHWDGNQWELKRIKYYGECSAVEFPPLKAIWSFSDSDLVITNGGSIGWFNGDTIRLNCGVNPLLTGAINKIWGTSSNDLHVVGNNGNIAHYQNGEWSRIESGTDLNINDIWGNTDNLGRQLILCAASNFGTNDQKKLLRINNNSVDTLSWTPQRTLYTLWFNSGDKIYAGGSGVFNNAGDIWKEETSLPHNFTFRIRGNDYNDIYATGGFGYFAHFNGYSWQVLSSIALQGGDYESLSTIGNTTCVVGYEGAKAVVTILKR